MVLQVRILVTARELLVWLLIKIQVFIYHAWKPKISILILLCISSVPFPVLPKKRRLLVSLKKHIKRCIAAISFKDREVHALTGCLHALTVQLLCWHHHWSAHMFSPFWSSVQMFWCLSSTQTATGFWEPFTTIKNRTCKGFKHQPQKDDSFYRNMMLL